MNDRRRGRLPDLLILAQEHWDQVERRNQLLVRRLAARNPSTRFLFAERALRPRDAPSWRWPTPDQVEANIWTLQRIRPVSDRVSSTLSDAVEARQAARAARAVGLQRPYVWTQDPHTADLLRWLPVVGLVYDLTDDWVAFESDPVRKAIVERRFQKLLGAADVVFACSPWLCRSAERAGARAVYLPNAVDAPRSAARMPSELGTLPRPRLGYAGTLHSSRLDVELICDAAVLRPDWSFAFLGPDLLEPADRVRLFAGPNVHYLGVRPHSEVSHYISGFDIGLVPNRISDFTESLDPLKTYEYLASGVPVLSTAAGIAPKLAEHVQLAASAAELVAQAESLLAGDDPARRNARVALVSDETWDARAAAIEREFAVDGAWVTDRSGVSIVIVSFNTRALLRRTLARLADISPVLPQTIVVDNGSSDGSQAMVRQEFAAVELIESPENIGFGAANNLAFKRCRGEFILLLNSDALLHDGALDELLAVARRHPEAAVIGPRLLNPDGTLQRSAWPFPSAGRLLLEAAGAHRILRRTPWYEDHATWDHREEREVDFLAGACLFIRASGFAEVEGFDENFHMYAEETDLQRRLRNRGWSVIFSPTAEATHIGGASAMGTSTRTSQFYAGQLLYLRKHNGSGAVLGARLALLVGSALRGRWTTARIASSVGRGMPRDLDRRSRRHRDWGSK